VKNTRRGKKVTIKVAKIAKEARSKNLQEALQRQMVNGMYCRQPG